MKFTEEELDFINEYERKQDESRKEYQENIQKVLEAFKPLIRHNREYLKYGIIKKWFKFTEEEQRKTALHNAITEVTAHSISWSIQQAREIAFKTLEEVNDHRTAEHFRIHGLKKIDDLEANL